MSTTRVLSSALLILLASATLVNARAPSPALTKQTSPRRSDDSVEVIGTTNTPPLPTDESLNRLQTSLNAFIRIFFDALTSQMIRRWGSAKLPRVPARLSALN